MDPKGDRMRKIKLGMLKLPDYVLENNSTILAEGKSPVKMAGNSLEGGPRPKAAPAQKSDHIINSADIPLPSNADIPLPSELKSANIPLPADMVPSMVNIPLPAKLESSDIPLPSDADIPLPSNASIPLPADKPPQRETRKKIKVHLESLKPDELECRSCVLRFTKQQEYDQHLQSEEHQQAIKDAFLDGTGSHGSSLVIPRHEKKESPSHDVKSGIVSFGFKKTVGQKISSTQPFYRRDDRSEKSMEMVKFLRLESAAANELGDASSAIDIKTENVAEENHDLPETSETVEDQGPKLMSMFVKVQSKDENGKLLDWPKEMIMYTHSEPKISYSCNPLCFDFSQLFPGKVNKSPARAAPAVTVEHDPGKPDDDEDAAEQDKSEKEEEDGEKKKSHKKKKKKKHRKHKDKESEEGKTEEGADGNESVSKHKKKKKKKKKEDEENEEGKENVEDDGAKKKHKKSKKRKHHSHHGSDGESESKTVDEKAKHKKRKKKRSKKRKKKHHHSGSEKSDADGAGKVEEKGTKTEAEKKDVEKHGNNTSADEADGEKAKDDKSKIKKRPIHVVDIHESVKPDVSHQPSIKIAEKRKISLVDGDSDGEKQLAARLMALSRTKVTPNNVLHMQKRIKKEQPDIFDKKTPSDRKRQTSESSVTESTTPGSSKRLKVTPKSHTTVRDSIPTATIAPVVNIKTEKHDESWSKIETSTAENIKSKWDTSDSDTENALDNIVKKKRMLKRTPVVQGPPNRPSMKQELVRTFVKMETDSRRTVTVNPLSTHPRPTKSNIPMANMSVKKPVPSSKHQKSSHKSVSRSPATSHSSRSRSRSRSRGRSYSRSSSRSRSRSYSSSSYSERESRRSGRHKRRKHSSSRSYSRSSSRSRSRSHRRRKRSSSYSDYSRSRSRSSSRSRSHSRSHRRRRRSYTHSRSYSRSYSSSRSRSRSRSHRRRKRRKRKRRSKSRSRSISVKPVKVSPKKVKKVEKKKEPIVDPGEIPLPDLSGKKEDELSAEKVQKLKDKKPRTDVGKTVAELVDSLPSDIPLPGQGDGDTKTVSSDALPNAPANATSSDKSFIGPLLPNNPAVPPPPPPPGLNMGPPRYPPQHGPPGPARPGHGPGYWDNSEYWDGPGAWDSPQHGPGPRPPYRGMRPPMYDHRMRGPPPPGYDPRMRGPPSYMNRPRGPGPHGPPGPGYMGPRHPGPMGGHYGPPRGQMPPDYYNDGYDCYNENYNEKESPSAIEKEPEAPPKKESPPPLPPAKAPSPKPPPPKKREPTPNPDIAIPPEQVEQYRQLQKKAAKHARKQLRRQQKKELGEPEDDSSSSDEEKEDETASVATLEEEVAMVEEGMMQQFVAMPMNAGQQLVMAQPQMVASPAGGQFIVAQGAGGQQVLLQQRPQPQLVQAGLPLQAGQPMIAVPQGHSMVASAAAAAAGAQPAHIMQQLPATSQAFVTPSGQIITAGPAMSHMQSMVPAATALQHHIQQIQHAQAVQQAQVIQHAQAQAQAQAIHAHQQAAAAAAHAGPIIVGNQILVPRVLRPAL